MSGEGDPVRIGGAGIDDVEKDSLARFDAERITEAECASVDGGDLVCRLLLEKKKTERRPPCVRPGRPPRCTRRAAAADEETTRVAARAGACSAPPAQP